MQLCELNVKESAYITKINTEKVFSERLADLGFIKGSKIECVIKNRKLGPFAYRIRGTLFAIRKSDAEKIEVTKAVQNIE